MGKSILIIAPYFPPIPRVGSFRPYRFVRHLKKMGFNPIVITFQTSDIEWSEQQAQDLRDIPIVKIQVPFSKDGIRTATKATSTKNKVVRKAPVRKWIDSLFPLDSWWPVMQMNYKTILNEVKNYEPELVWSTADPWSSHWLALKLKEELNIPWIADFRDPWILCNFRNTYKPNLIQKIDAKWEEKFLKRADLIIFTAEATTKKYVEAYPYLKSKVETIYNSFDLEVLADKTSVKIEQDDFFKIIFFGAFRELSPAKPFLKVLAKLKDINSKILDQIRIYTNGALTEDDLALAEQIGCEQCFIKIPYVRYEESKAYLKQADLLLLSTKEDRDDIIPAKMWDYMPVGKPILGLSSNSEVHNIIHENKIGVCYHPHQITEAAEFLSDLIQGNSALKGYSMTHNSLLRFDATTRALELKNLINRLTDG